jgi:hypothetical protein
MKEVLETAEIVALMGLMFSFALLVEWAALQAFFKAMSAGLRPAVETVDDLAVRRTQH